MSSYTTDEETYREAVKWKRSGGVKLEIRVCKSTWVSGISEAQPHEPFVAIGPADWEGEEELSFFNREQLQGLIAKLQWAAEEAWPTRQT